MIPLIAWRNIWRNPMRSLVVIGAVALGIWATLFTIGFSYGINVSFINSAIENRYSHLQLHNPEYAKDKEARFVMPDGENVVQQLHDRPAVQAVSGRLLANGMLGVATGAQGVRIVGIEPGDEAGVSKLDEKIVDGGYFETEGRNPVLVGKALAEKLKLKLRSKVVLTFQDVNGEVVAGAFRVAGIFNTNFTQFDEGNVYVKAPDLVKLLSTPKAALHEIAVLMADPNQTEAMADELRSQYPELLTQTWSQLAPELEMMEAQLSYSIWIIMGIMMLALIFGIVNTMLMAVLERYRELGMLMAVGMNKTKVFAMVVFETLMLAFVGAPIGMFLGFATVWWLKRVGINLSAFSEGLSAFGMGNVVYPKLDAIQYFQMGGMVAVMAVLAALYPAYKAISLKPLDAIRKI